jgi:hypothetical protein
MTPKSNKKKPYETPSIQSEDVLEGAALSCGKCKTHNPTGSGAGNCRSLQKLS